MNTLQWEDNLKQQIPGLRRYARALTRNVACADDLVQDCLETAWNKRQNWTVGSNLRAWLFTIMHNHFINDIRRQKIHEKYLLEPDHSSSIHQANTQTSEEQKHLIYDLENSLMLLRPEIREVIVLAGLENLSYKQIAEITDTAIGTVMSRLSRGRKELQEIMSGEPSKRKEHVPVESKATKPKLVSIK